MSPPLVSPLFFVADTRKATTIVLSSVAWAAENSGGHLGEFVEAGEYRGRRFYKQRHTEGHSDCFLYSEGGMWWVGDTLGELNGLLKNNQNTSVPMTTGWLYWDGEEWNNNDTSLTLEFTSLSPCKLVRVAGEGDVVEKQGNSLGDYRFAFHCAQ